MGTRFTRDFQCISDSEPRRALSNAVRPHRLSLSQLVLTDSAAAIHRSLLR
jgi:hypothetical protein